jgi:hypothetical protein
MKARIQEAKEGNDERKRTSSVHAVHQRQKRRDDRSVDLFLFAAPYRREPCSKSHQCQSLAQMGQIRTINLVEEDDAWLACLSLLEQKSKLSLGLSDPFGQAISSFPHEEGFERSTSSQSVSSETQRALTPSFHSHIFLPSVLQLAARARARRVFPVPGGP